MDLMRSGFLSVLPWLTMAIAANVAGWAADTMVAKGMSITKVRKIMQTASRCCHCPVATAHLAVLEIH